MSRNGEIESSEEGGENGEIIDIVECFDKPEFFDGKAIDGGS